MNIFERLEPAFRAETIRHMNDFWGERCPEVEPGCPCCDAWAFHDRYGVCPTFENLEEWKECQA